MERLIHVLPVCWAGCPTNVDSFIKQENLEGSAFENMEDAEKYLLSVKAKYADDDRWENFAIFVTEAHAIETPLGFKVIDTAQVA